MQAKEEASKRRPKPQAAPTVVLNKKLIVQTGNSFESITLKQLQSAGWKLGR